MHTSVVEIVPGGSAASAGAGYVAFAGFSGRTRRWKHRASEVTEHGTSAPPGYPVVDNIEGEL